VKSCITYKLHTCAIFIPMKNWLFIQLMMKGAWTSQNLGWVSIFSCPRISSITLAMLTKERCSYFSQVPWMLYQLGTSKVLFKYNLLHVLFTIRYGQCGQYKYLSLAHPKKWPKESLLHKVFQNSKKVNERWWSPRRERRRIDVLQEFSSLEAREGKKWVPNHSNPKLCKYG